MTKVTTALNKWHLQLVLEVLAGPAPSQSRGHNLSTWQPVQTCDSGSTPRSGGCSLLLPSWFQRAKSIGKHAEVATCPGKSPMPGNSHSKPLHPGTSPSHALKCPLPHLGYAKPSPILFPYLLANLQESCLGLATPSWLPHNCGCSKPAGCKEILANFLCPLF